VHGNGDSSTGIAPQEKYNLDNGSLFRFARLLILAGAICLVLLGLSKGSAPTETARSRLATVVALADYGTWHIDPPSGETRIEFEKNTIDKVKVGEHLISSKPPVLSLAMTAEYLVIRAVFGWNLNNKEDVGRIVSLMALTFSGIPYLLTLIFFDKTAALYHVGMKTRMLALTGLAFGTQLWGFSSHVNNHLPATALLTIALYFALGLSTANLTPKPWRFVLFGLCGSLAITIDFPSGVFVTIAGLFLLGRFPRQTVTWTLLGALPALALHVGVMLAITGSPFPVQMHPEMYLYESSYWRNPRGIDALNEPIASYLAHMTFGRKGLFLLFPITFLGLLAATLPSIRNEKPNRALLITGIAGFVSLTAYYAMSTNNYGGHAYGFRWYIIATPILLLMGAQVMSKCTKPWQWLLLTVMFAISLFSGWQCFMHPWEVNAEWTTRFLGPSI